MIIPDFLDGGGEMGARIRAHDWSTSPLGSPDGWPQALRVALQICLNTPIVSAVHWGLGLLTFYNDAYAPALADRHPRALGQPFGEVWADIWDVLGPQIASVLETGCGFSTDRQLLRMKRDGHVEDTYWIYSFAPLHDDHGNVSGIFVTALDTTDKVETETKLSAERDRQRKLFEQAPGFIAVMSGPTLRFDFVNEAYERLFGPREFVGRTVRDVFSDLNDQSFFGRIEQVYRSGERLVARASPIRLPASPHSEPTERFLDFIYEPVRDEKGTVTGLFIQGSDVTEAHVAQEALRESETRSRALVNASSDVVYRMSADWTEMRQLGGRGFLFDTDPTSVRWLDEYILPEDRDDILTLIEDVTRTKGTLELEHRVRRPDGSTGWTYSRAVPVLTKDGEIAEWFGMATDVTERRKADDQLRLMADAVPQIVWITDAEGRLEFFNRQWSDYIGSADLPTAIGDFAGQYIHPDDQARTTAAFREALRHGGVFEIEHRLRAKDGSYRWFLVRAEPHRDADTDRIVRWFGASTDIDDRRSAENALRASEEFNRRVLYSSGDCIKVLSLEARLEFMTEGDMCLMEVDDFKAIAGAYWPDFWQGNELPKVLEAIDKAKRGGTGRFRGFATTLKGSPRWWDVLVTAINGADGRPEKLLSVSRDVTSSRQAEESLRELNETLERQVTIRTIELRRFRDIVEATASPICAFDTDFRLIAFNSAHNHEFRRVNGFDSKLGDVFPDLFIPEQRPVMRALMTRALAGERFVVTEEFGRPELGQPLWEISYTPLRNEDGAVIGAFHLATDISDRLRAEADLAATQDALRQSQKMEAMGSLTGGVAHDFNNLLTPIVGALDMLSRQDVGGEREKRLIAGAAQSAERAKVLVQRLLAFARRQPLQPVAVDVGQLVNGMSGLITSTTGPRINVVIELAKDLPPANADPNQLEMALLNLAVNARDAMPNGGTLRISARAGTAGIPPADLSPGRYVRLSVTDTGSGMDKTTLARAIEPFFSTKGIGKGTGLGLSMVHGLASQLGGALTIESDPGLGTAIDLWLPQADHTPEALILVQTNVTSEACGTALLVDDEDFVRLSTADMLGDLGYEVIEAASAIEALDVLARKRRVDLVVTDHLMPGMSGMDLARAIRDQHADLPVLIVSGYADMDGVAPHQHRLTKPFRKDELAASLSALAASRGS